MNGGEVARPVRGLLPRLFFEHFRPSSFALETNGATEGFLVGFRSQSSPTIAYIHFVGVSPSSRGRGYGRMLYERFFEAVPAWAARECGASLRRSIPARLLFIDAWALKSFPENGKIDEFSVVLDHAGKGQHRVLFRKQLISS
jgi:GNAT superfamily N-acetyltransferase